MTLAVAGRPGHTGDASVMDVDVVAAAQLRPTSKEPTPLVKGVGAKLVSRTSRR